MKYILPYKLFEFNTEENDELESEPFNYEDEEGFQRKMRIKELRKQYKAAPYIVDPKSHGNLSGYSPLQNTDVPLDVLIKQKQKEDESKEKDILHALNVFDNIEDFKMFEPIYYRWIIDNKKGLNFFPAKYFKGGVKNYFNLKRSSIKSKPQPEEKQKLSKKFLDTLAKIKKPEPKVPYSFFKEPY